MKSRRLKPAAIAVRGLGLMLAVSAFCQQGAPRLPEVPAAQKAFCTAGHKYWQAQQDYNNISNPFEKRRAQPPDIEAYYKILYDAVGPTGDVKDWQGSIGFALRGNFAFLTFAPVCEPNLVFTNVANTHFSREVMQEAGPMTVDAAEKLFPNGKGYDHAFVSGHLFPVQDPQHPGFASSASISVRPPLVSAWRKDYLFAIKAIHPFDVR